MDVLIFRYRQRNKSKDEGWTRTADFKNCSLLRGPPGRYKPALCARAEIWATHKLLTRKVTKTGRPLKYLPTEKLIPSLDVAIEKGRALIEVPRMKGGQLVLVLIDYWAPRDRDGKTLLPKSRRGGKKSIPPVVAGIVRGDLPEYGRGRFHCFNDDAGGGGLWIAYPRGGYAYYPEARSKWIRSFIVDGPWTVRGTKAYFRWQELAKRARITPARNAWRPPDQYDVEMSRLKGDLLRLEPSCRFVLYTKKGTGLTPSIPVVYYSTLAPSLRDRARVR